MSIKITEEEIQKYIVELENIVNQLNESLPKEIRHFEISRISKIPSKVTSLREVLLYRITELSSSILELVKLEKAVAALILSRAQFETIVLWLFLIDKIEKVCTTTILDNFDNEIMRLLFGGKLENSPEQAYNILTLIDKVSKKYPKLREYYDGLSEFAHPNTMGTHAYYARFDEGNFIEILGPDDIKSDIKFTLVITIGLLEMYVSSYNYSKVLLPTFIEICEKNITGKR